MQIKMILLGVLALRGILQLDERGAVDGQLAIEVEKDLPVTDREYERYAVPMLQCALNALCFMHVKGARVDAPPLPTRQARRQWERSKQQIKWLRIEPLERFVREASLRGFDGRRAHLVRGHYKDFEHGAGVGGNPKARGLYWTPPHVRGNAKHGIVAKQYETGEIA